MLYQYSFKCLSTFWKWHTKLSTITFKSVQEILYYQAKFIIPEIRTQSHLRPSNDDNSRICIMQKLFVLDCNFQKVLFNFCGSKIGWVTTFGLLQHWFNMSALISEAIMIKLLLKECRSLDFYLLCSLLLLVKNAIYIWYKINFRFYAFWTEPACNLCSHSYQHQQWRQKLVGTL